ncbi:anaphase promoting complex subunit 5 [Lambiella insularis]|nr:anaphase promoting complex subunit 5 [Lambiella insularis]
MSRYLTAEKLGLLALISLYAESVVPTAATMPILSFIASVLPEFKGTVAGAQPFRNRSTVAASIVEIRRATVTHASGIPGRTVWDLFLKKLWKVDSLDALHIFFDSLSILLPRCLGEPERDIDVPGVPESTRIRFSKTSPLGTLIRRARVEFERLQLHDGIALWKNFVRYKEATFSTWRKRNPQIGKDSFDVNLTIGQTKRNNKVRAILYVDLEYGGLEVVDFSTEDVERLLEFQRDQMQSLEKLYRCVAGHLLMRTLVTGVRISGDMRDRLEDLAQAGVTIPSLSHYVKTFYQYALLNLAILQKDYGCLPEAIAAMHETISTARENKDIGCLNWSLSWLYHLGKAHPAEVGDIQRSGGLGTNTEALAFMRSKAKEATMWSLLSTTLLSEARLNVVNGESISIALEIVMKASHLALIKKVSAAAGSELCVHSSVFSRLGINYVAWSLEEIFFQCHARNSAMDEILYTVCKRSSALAFKGRYDQALSALEDIDRDDLRTLKHQQYWMTCVRLLKLQRSLRRNDVNAAEHFLSLLQATPPSDRETTFLIVHIDIELHLRRQNFSKAMHLLDKHARRLHAEEADIHLRIKLMILKAHVYDKAGLVQKGFSIAIRAASLAYRARLLPALWDSIGAVCRVLISVREFDAAARLLKGVMPQVFEVEDCELAAVLLSHLADAHIGIAGRMVAGSTKQKEHMAKASACLEGSFDEYARIDNVNGQCEMLTKKAIILQLSGDMVLANDCAAKYLAIKKNAKEERVT